MIDHRKTSSRRAYSLPGWFFVVTMTLSVVGIAGAAWVLAENPFRTPAIVVPPPPTSSVPTPDEPVGEPDRQGIEVAVLNASTTPGLAGRVGETAEAAGWTVAEVGNWTFGAAQNAVYYPEGHEVEARLLADDLAIELVRAATSGMSQDHLTVLLLTEP